MSDHEDEIDLTITDQELTLIRDCPQALLSGPFLPRGQFQERPLLGLLFGPQPEDPSSNLLFPPKEETIGYQLISWRIDSSIEDRNPHFQEDPLRNDHTNGPLWDEYVRKGFAQIVQLVSFFFLIQHEPGNDNYGILVTKLLTAILRIVDQLSGIYRPKRELLPAASSVSLSEQKIANIAQCVKAILRTVPLKDLEVADEVSFKQKETNPVLQWCQLYFTPSFYRQTEQPFLAFVQDVYNALLEYNGKFTEQELLNYQSRPTDDLFFPHGFVRRA